MSRVGKMPIALPKGVDVSVTADKISVKGSLGTLVRPVNELVTVKNEGGKVLFSPANESVAADAMSGTMRALVANMVNGVSKGFEKKLSLVGVGYKAQAQGAKLNLTVGYSHPVNKDMPAGITVATPAPTEIVIKGADRQRVGQVAAGDLTSSVIYAGVGRWKAGPNAYNPANQPNNKYTVVYRDLLTGFDLGYWNGNGTSRYRKPAPNSTESWCKRRTATAPPLARTFYCSSFDRPPFAAARTRPARFAAFNRYAGVISSISDSYGFPYSDAGTGKVQLGLDRATTLKVTILPDRRKR